MNFQSSNNEEPQAFDDYGYEECAPTGRDSPEIASPKTAGMVRWDESQSTSTSARPCPMPADRLARKQRSFSRRGGVGHSQLLKSAVMAAMEAMDSEDESRAGRRGSPVIPAAALVDLSALTSPRKRARLFSAPDSPQVTDSAVAVASEFMGALSMGDTSESRISKEPVRGVPRRTSRRTSYGSKISSDVSDGEDWIDE